MHRRAYVMLHSHTKLYIYNKINYVKVKSICLLDIIKFYLNISEFWQNDSFGKQFGTAVRGKVTPVLLKKSHHRQI